MPTVNFDTVVLFSFFMVNTSLSIKLVEGLNKNPRLRVIFTTLG